VCWRSRIPWMRREVGGDRLIGSKELSLGDAHSLIGLYDLVTARLWREGNELLESLRNL
jgi:hypothetical protein